MHPQMLMRALVRRLLSSRSSVQSMTLLRWLEHLTTNHVALLLSYPELCVDLAPLFRANGARLETYTRLLSLKERIEVLQLEVSP